MTTGVLPPSLPATGQSTYERRSLSSFLRWDVLSITYLPRPKEPITHSIHLSGNELAQTLFESRAPLVCVLPDCAVAGICACTRAVDAEDE